MSVVKISLVDTHVVHVAPIIAIRATNANAIRTGLEAPKWAAYPSIRQLMPPRTYVNV
jgi:hypothetical protein